MPSHEYPIPWVTAQKNLQPVGIVRGPQRTEVPGTINHLASQDWLSQALAPHKKCENEKLKRVSGWYRSISFRSYNFFWARSQYQSAVSSTTFPIVTKNDHEVCNCMKAVIY